MDSRPQGMLFRTFILASIRDWGRMEEYIISEDLATKTASLSSKLLAELY
jgi:hypothetical protein